eukprot:m.18704 g.18704  ORF g.18704 m.18704 type:complete len:327 (+) comp7425_c0_seq1:71-1051(+)
MSKVAKFKSPQELVKKVKEALEKVDEGKKSSVEEAAKMLVALQQALYGTPEAEPQAEVIAQIAQEIYGSHLLLLMIQALPKLDFESKKEAVQIFIKVLKREIGARLPTVEYICSNDGLLLELLKGYENPDIALSTGQLLRECIKKDPLAKILLAKPEFFSLFKAVQVSSFDMAVDAFSTFKELLTAHKILAADFLEKNYDRVFAEYDALLHSENYVTRRQSLKLLGELLLERANFTTMTRFIGTSDNLKMVMGMLRDSSKNVQYEAFHVFKVFVANPNKSKAINDILLKNKEKLVEFLGKFQNDRNEDEQFAEEKQYLVKQLKEIK